MFCQLKISKISKDENSKITNYLTCLVYTVYHLSGCLIYGQFVYIFSFLLSCNQITFNYVKIKNNVINVKFCENTSEMDLVSSQGLRIDGRRPNELRKIRCKLGVFSQPEGSAYLEQGNTKVLAAVYGPHQVISLLILNDVYKFIKFILIDFNCSTLDKR